MLIDELREIRIEKKIKQYTVADHLGIHNTVLTRIEKGERKMDVEMLHKYALYLGYDLVLIKRLK